jgi:epoxide hydrolase 4
VTALHEGRLVANGLSFHLVEAGRGEPILFLHGFPEYSGAWRAVMQDLSTEFRTIAIDTRGVNLSDGPDFIDGYRFDDLVEDVRQVIAALGYAKVTLVGHDWGGFIAWEVAIRHPECLDRLVILNTAHTGVFDALLREGGEQAAMSKYMLAFRSSRGEELTARNDFAGFRQAILEPSLAAGTMTSEEAEDYLALWRNPKSLTAGLNYYRANKSGPPSGDDPPPRALNETQVRVSTLVIWGEKDLYFSTENLDRLPTVVEDLVVRRFPDNDHWIVHQRPADVAALIGAFAKGALTDHE